MSSRMQVYLLVVLFTLIGLGFALYKIFVMDFPLFPGESRNVWTLESKVSFRATGGPLEATLTLPTPYGNGSIIDEHYASSGFGFTTLEQDGRRYARWTRRDSERGRDETLYYKSQVTVTRDFQQQAPAPTGVPSQPLLRPNEREAAAELVSRLERQSSGLVSFTSLLLRELHSSNPDQDVAFLLADSDRNPTSMALLLLRQKGVHARIIKGLLLEDGRRRQRYTEIIEIYDGSRWVQFTPETGREGLPENYFVWERGDVSLLDVLGGQASTIEFAMVSNSLPARTVLMMERQANKAALIDFSIYSLPVEQQGVFKTLLLIPIGALVVVIMRIIVGISTSGTFMPILISLAFIETTLTVGLPVFLLVVSIGLWIRYYLSNLNLLLVARVSAVIVVVLGIMGVLSIASYKLGVAEAMSVTLFPTIILSWTIERMSILWEEEGFAEVTKQGGGSLVVAILAYLMMDNAMVKHLTFNFPELILILLALILLIGQYSGYRLSELYRFRHFVK